MADQTVLVVEDEENLAVALRYNLVREGYSVRVANDGSAGLEIARSTSPDLIILDVMLPGISGYDICKEIRRESDVPILMLTARGEEVDKVVGLELGADDYVTKPFSVRELMARVRALLRRPRGSVADASLPKTAKSGDLEIDNVSHVVRKNGVAIELKPREFDLLALLVANPGRAYTRDQLLNALWGRDYIGDARTVDVHVRWLRRKIEDEPSNPQRLVTLRGVGYRFEG